MARVSIEAIENALKFHLLNLFFKSMNSCKSGHALPLLILFPFPRYHISGKFFDVFWVIGHHKHFAACNWFF